MTSKPSIRKKKTVCKIELFVGTYIETCTNHKICLTPQHNLFQYIWLESRLRIAINPSGFSVGLTLRDILYIIIILIRARREEKCPTHPIPHTLIAKPYFRSLKWTSFCRSCTMRDSWRVASMEIPISPPQSRHPHAVYEFVV